MPGPRRRLGTGPAAPAAQAPPAAPRRLPVEHAADDRRVDDDQEQTQPGQGRRPLGTGAPTPTTPDDTTPLFFYGGS